MNTNKQKRTLIFIREQIQTFISNWKYYGLLYAIFSLLWWMTFYLKIPFSYKLSKLAILYKTKFWNNRLDSHYADIIQKVNAQKQVQNNTQPTTIIWFFWGQGENEMPVLVKACYNQLQTFNQNIKLVTLKNLHEFITIDKQILTKVYNKQIKWANFSDIIRMSLLSKYGGLWLDSTVWVKGKIPFDILTKYQYWTASGNNEKLRKAEKTCFWSSFEWNWSSSILYANQPQFILYTFVSEMLKAIAIREKHWPDYVIQDYLIHYAYTNFPDVTNCVNKNELFCNNRIMLARIMNQKFDKQQYKELTKFDYFFKLSFRTNWKKTTSNQELTYYGRILEGPINPEDIK